MKTISIAFKVSHQSIWRVDSIKLMSGSQNYVKAGFTFSSEWDGLTKTAIFKVGDTAYQVILEDDSCTVPWEVLQSAGSFTVSVFGGDLITVDTAQCHVGASGYTSGGAPSDPTETVYQQILDSLDERLSKEELDGTSIYIGSDEKVHARTGENIIDDTKASSSTTYSLKG